MQRNILRWTIPFIMGLGVLGSCENPNTEEENTEETESTFCLEEPFRSKVQINELKKVPVTDNLHFTGAIHYAEDDLIVYKSLLEGTVTHVHFELGDKVNKGQKLATIHSAELNQLQKEKSQLESELALNEEELKISQEMLEDGLASRIEVQKLENEIKKAKSALQSLASELSMYSSTDQQGVFEIRSPKSGFIVQKGLNPGTNISALDDALFSISSLEKVWVLVDIHARDIPNVKRGAKAVVQTTSYPGRLFEGQIDQVSQVLDEEDKVLKARVFLKNTDLLLKPGMHAEAWVQKESELEEAVAIPNANIIYHNKKQYCLIYHDDCHIEMREIDHFAINDEFSYVKAGFEEGEKIVASHELLIFEEVNKK